MSYNYTTVQTSTNIAELLINLDNATGNYIGIALLFVIFAVFFIKFLDEGAKMAYATSMFITTCCAVLMGAMAVAGVAFISFDVVLYCIILSMIGAVMMIWQ